MIGHPLGQIEDRGACAHGSGAWITPLIFYRRVPVLGVRLGKGAVLWTQSQRYSLQKHMGRFKLWII